MLTPQPQNGRASQPAKQTTWPIIMCIVGGYLVDLGPSKALRWHTVKKDRTCSCGVPQCFAAKAVEAYLKAGGQRAPDVTASDPHDRFPQQCPICQARTIQDGSGWTCTQSRVHYFEFRTQRLRASRERYLQALDPVSRATWSEIFQAMNARAALVTRQ